MRDSLGSIEDLGDGRFRIFISSGYDHRTGKRVRSTKTIRGTRREAERVRANMLMRAGKGSADKLTVTGFLEDVWLPTKDSRRRKTVEGYATHIKASISPYIGHLSIEDVTAYVVERWMSDLLKQGKSPQTVKHARAVLKNGMRAAVRWRLIDRDPTEGTEIPDIDYRPTVLSAAQLNQYIDAFSGHLIEPLIVIAIAAGLRRSEYTALDWSDVDFGNGTVSVTKGLHQSGPDTWFEDPKSKTSKRTVALPEWAMEILRPLRGVGPLVTYNGSRIRPCDVSRIYRDHLETLELPRVPLRDLRNSYGTYLYDAGVPLSEIADTLGHSTMEITRKHYVERSHREANRVAVAAVENLRACQNVPKSQDTHELNPQGTVNRSSKSVNE